MPGQTHCERRLALFLPIASLLSSLLLLLVSVAWKLRGRPLATCSVPPQYSAPMASYALEICSSGNAVLHPVSTSPVTPGKTLAPITDVVLAPGEWAARVPGRFLETALLLLLPLLLWDVLSRVVEAAAPAKRPFSTAGSVVRAGAVLASRLAWLVCLAVATANSRMDAPRDGGDGGFLFATGAVEEKPTNVLCSYQVRQMANIRRYTMNCSVGQAPQVVLAKALLLTLWHGLVFVVAWAAVGTVCAVVLMACPSTRRSALGGEEEEGA